MKLQATSTKYWADFRAERHHAFEAVTEAGVKLVIYVSRVHLVDENQRRTYENELVTTRLRDEGNYVAFPAEPKSGNVAERPGTTTEDPQETKPEATE